MNSNICIVKNDDYTNPTISIVVDGVSVVLTTKKARQFASNIVKCVDELEGKSDCKAAPANKLEQEPTKCRLKYWANPLFQPMFY